MARLLILGGTLFLGRHLAEQALARGHHVTLFHRGRTRPGLFPSADRVLGDRDGGLGALDGGRWDAAIDTSGYVPRVVGDSARRLAPAVGHYTFVSSISVYAEPLTLPVTEASPLATIVDPADETIAGGRYGALKALCEAAAEAGMPDRTLVVRPGLIVGPHDSTDRFPYWPRRMARGGDVLAPGRPEQPVQLIDARDLADWMLDLAEAGVIGTFNATGPESPLTMNAALEACARAAGTPSRLVWVDEAFLLERGVRPWTELPLWVPAADLAFQQVDASRAVAAGLRFRPLVETARDTLEWDRGTPASERPVKPGVAMPGPLDADREAELLDAWRATGGTLSPGGAR